MIIAGEISGDMHAAGLVRSVLRRMPDTRFFGIGGDEMRRAGVETLHDVNEMAVAGFSEAYRRLGFFRRVFNEMLDEAQRRRPDAVILVDYPGFNLRFAARVHARGVKTLYYICPQVWAWKRSRIPLMARAVDRLITIFPFEAAHFRGTGLRVDFAGNPLVDEALRAWETPPPELPWDGKPQVALLPGSRGHEIDRILPPMWEAASLIERAHPDASFILPTPSPAVEGMLRAKLRTLRVGPSRHAIVTGNTRQVLLQARAALVASGTATVEASLMRCPMVIAYKASTFTYVTASLLIKVKWLGMVNIVAGREVCPEMLQSDCTPSGLAAAIEPLLGDTPRRAAMLADLAAVNTALGSGGAEERAAGFVVDELNRA